MPIAFAPRVRPTLCALAAPFAFALALAATPVVAQDDDQAPPVVAGEDATGPDTVLATVGGVAITEADLAYAAEDLAQDLQQIPPEDRRAFLLTVLIDMKVMANAARDEGLDQSDIFARRLSYLEDRALRRAFFAEIIEGAVTEERVQALYDDIVDEFEAEPEVRARHILVETREQAEEIRAEIEDGLAFEDAAAEYSIDQGSAANGGDVGFFGTGMMVAPFEQAAFALDVGQMSEPVESQFGFHLILLEDRRVSAPPPLDQIQAQIAQQVLYQSFDEIVGALKDEAEIDVTDPDLAEAVEAQSGL